MKRQVKKPALTKIADHIAHLSNGGTYMPSREVIRLMAIDPVKGQAQVNREHMERSVLATRYARTLNKKREGNSKYVPHQGSREMRRRAGIGPLTFAAA